MQRITVTEIRENGLCGTLDTGPWDYPGGPVQHREIKVTENKGRYDICGTLGIGSWGYPGGAIQYSVVNAIT